MTFIFMMLSLLVYGIYFAPYFTKSLNLINFNSQIFEKFNNELVAYGIDKISTNSYKSEDEVAKKINAKMNLLKTTKDEKLKKYQAYKDFMIDEYAYIPKTLLNIELYLPPNPNIEQLLNPSIFFNYDIAKLLIDDINSTTTNTFYHNTFDIQTVINTMTLDEKIKQMFIWNVNGLDSNAYTQFIKTNMPGGLIFMRGSIGSNLNHITDSIQRSSKFPTLIAVDQEGGVVSRVDRDNFPSAQDLQQSSIVDVNNAFDMRSNLLKSLGFNLNFGIVADITTDPNSYVYYRVFGGNSAKVAPLIAAAVKGSTTLSTLKHFPGHGKTNINSHQMIPQINMSYDQWLQNDALPFKSGIDAGANFVMMGHLIFNQIDDKPASLSKKWNSILRNDLNFKGVIITDDIKMLTKSGFDGYEAISQAALSGNDMLLIIESNIIPDAAYKIVKDLVESGKITLDDLNSRIRRILSTKKLTINP